MSSRTSNIIIVIIFKTWCLNLLLLPGVKKHFSEHLTNAVRNTLHIMLTDLVQIML